MNGSRIGHWLLRCGLWSIIGLFPGLVTGQVVEEDDGEVIVSGGEQARISAIPDLEGAARLMVKQTSEFRADQGLNSLARNADLDAAARYFAGFMARTSKYGHRADGQRPSERAKEHGYQSCIVAENIAWYYSTQNVSESGLAAKFMEGWKSSEKHRQNMVDPDVTEIGLAVAYSQDTNHFYAVQMLGRPKSQQLEIRIANHTAAVVEYEVAKKVFWLPAGFTRVHQRCRPCEVVFYLDDGDAPEPTREYVLRKSASFRITRDAFGSMVIRREQSVDVAGPAAGADASSFREKEPAMR